MPQAKRASGPRATAFKALAWFFACNFPLTLLIGYRYILNAVGADSVLSGAFLHLAFVSNFLTIYLAAALPLALAAACFPRRGPLLGAAAVAMFLLQLLVFIDSSIYAVFRFHINGMVLNLFVTEGAWDSVHLGTSTLITLAGAVAAVGVFEFFLLRRLLTRGPSAAPASHKARRLAAVTACAGLLVIVCDKAVFAVSDLYGGRSVLRYEKVFPLYQPLTIKRMMERVFHYRPDRPEEIAVGPGEGTLLYPKEPLQRQKTPSLPNIVWILVDAWRYDMLVPELTPNIYQFAKRSLVFTNHYSGGNATRFGVFSIFYGVYGSYWHHFLNERQSPVLLDELTKLGYEFKILSATRLTYPEFRKTAFVRLTDSIEDRFAGDSAAEKDPRMAARFLSWLDERDPSRPFFSFVFFDAPHGPFEYPREFERFQPSAKTANFAALTKEDVVRLKNGYRNSLLFDDDLTGRLLRKLEGLGLLANTIVLISADHGEEFLERGRFGHTSAFCREQTGVPLILHVPGMKHREVSYRTSHLDVVPTFLSLLGYTTPPGAYSQGRPMLNGPGSPYVVSSGWNDCSIIGDDGTVVFSTETYNTSRFEVRDPAYQPVEDAQGSLKARRGELLQVARGFREFLR